MSTTSKKSNAYATYWLPRLMGNRFFLTTFFFTAWLFFFDRNSLIQQTRLQRTINELTQKKQYYQDEIEVVKADREALLTNINTLEQFARERYFFKRSNEDVFIIRRKDAAR